MKNDKGLKSIATKNSGTSREPLRIEFKSVRSIGLCALNALIMAG